jgi:hypothetical protein
MLGRLGARLLVFGRHTDGKPDNGRRAVKCEHPRHDGHPLYPAAQMRYIVIRDTYLPDFQVGKTRLSIRDGLGAKPPEGRKGPSLNMKRAKSAGLSALPVIPAKAEIERELKKRLEYWDKLRQRAGATN